MKLALWLGALFLVGFFLFVLRGQSLKDNLDLPFDSSSHENENEEVAPDIIFFYGQTYEADCIVFCCDGSGSMRGPKWQRLQAELLKNTETFNQRTQFAIVLFNHRLTQLPSRPGLIEATPVGRLQARSFIAAFRPMGSTCTKAALIESIKKAEMSSARRRMVVLLSDGVNYCPSDPNGNDAAKYDADILDAVKKENDSSVRINTVCLGKDNQVRDSFMRDLANQNSGKFARVQD